MMNRSIAMRLGILLFYLCINVTSNCQTILHSENFDDCGLVSWQTVAASGDSDASDEWICNGGRMEVNGFGGGADEDWLISPGINLNLSFQDYMIFWYNNGFSGADLTLFYSTDFSGTYTSVDIANATWIDLNISLFDNAANSQITNDMPYVIDIASIVGTQVYFAFRYTATGAAGGSEFWAIDNISIIGDYYAGIPGSSTCCDLKSSLHSLITSGHNPIPYTGSTFDVWDSHFVTDRRLNDTNTAEIVRDRYSENPLGSEPYTFTLGEDRDTGGSAGSEGIVYNREHVFPRSWWGGGTMNAQYSDLHLVIPVDKFMNTTRSNFPYGEVASASYTSLNGSKLGASGSVGYTGTAFEPIHKYKGDIARIMFYVATRYEDEIGFWETESSVGDMALNGDACVVYEDWFINQMLAWHQADPVDDLEIDRNNYIYAIQGNRNPFVDQPSYVNDLWETCLTVAPVTLSNWTATLKQSGILLEWSTLSELNNNYFLVERSHNGRDFQPLFEVKGETSSKEEKQYQFLDDSPIAGPNYYRLKQVDLDGTQASFGIISQTWLEEKSRVQFSSHLVTNIIEVNLSSEASLHLFSTAGQKLKQWHLSQGYHALSITDLPKGLYLLKATSHGQEIESTKLIKL